MVACANSTDAYTMIQQSVHCDDPVIFFEPKRRYWDKAEVDPAAELGDALARWTGPGSCCDGTDVTLLCYGPMVRTCVESAVAARAEGRSWRSSTCAPGPAGPADTIFESVRAHRPAAWWHEAPVTGGLGAEIAARITEECFYQLESPVLRVGGFSTPYPPSRLEEHYLPDLDRVLDAVDRTIAV